MDGLVSPRTVMPLLLVLLLLISACSNAGEPPADASEDATEAAIEPTSPAATAPPGIASAAPGVADDPNAPLGPRPRPQFGPVVLATIEGPTTDRAATDVVLRGTDGQSLDAFRLPGAARLHGMSGGRWALVQTFDDRWALLDVAVPRLTLLTFPGPAPTTDPQISGRLAYWPDPENPWIMRLDDGSLYDLLALTGEVVEVTDHTPDGSVVLLGGSIPRLLDTGSGAVRELPDAPLSMAADGTILWVERAADRIVLRTQAADGSGTTEQAELPALGTPVSLPAGRVFVAGPAGSLVEEDGTVTPSAGTGSVRGRPRLLDGGGRLLVPVDAGLTVVDIAQGIASLVPGSAGFEIVDDDATAVVWAVSSDPQQPGVIAIDSATGQATAMLQDTPTTSVGSIEDDGGRAVVTVGPEGHQAVIASADGSVENPLGDGSGDIVTVALNPEEPDHAVGLIVGTSRSVLLASATGETTLPDAWTPLWLRTQS